MVASETAAEGMHAKHQARNIVWAFTHSIESPTVDLASHLQMRKTESGHFGSKGRKGENHGFRDPSHWRQHPLGPLHLFCRDPHLAGLVTHLGIEP